MIIIPANEEWKQIKDFPKYYISNLGNVKSKAREKEKILKPITTDRGYKIVALYKRNADTAKNEKKNIRVHRLVAKYFLKDFAEKKEVHHKNKNRADNRAENLQCLYRKEHLDLHKKEEAAATEAEQKRG